MKDSILLTKSKAFALRVVRLYKYLRERKESVIAKQMLRSGTSIGANIAESPLFELELGIDRGMIHRRNHQSQDYGNQKQTAQTCLHTHHILALPVQKCKLQSPAWRSMVPER